MTIVDRINLKKETQSYRENLGKRIYRCFPCAQAGNGYHVFALTADGVIPVGFRWGRAGQNAIEIGESCLSFYSRIFVKK